VAGRQRSRDLLKSTSETSSSTQVEEELFSFLSDKHLTRLLKSLRFFDIVFFAETLYAACRIDKFLFAGKKRVAGRANLNLDILCRRARFYHIAAGAGNRRQFVIRMYSLFHIFLTMILVVQ
jgi:hypothetical protein